MIRGMIVLWYGAIVDIPAGWVLCDGTNDTPDLRDKFIVGAGGGYAVGATGGDFQHVHFFTTNGHFHTIPAGADFQAGPNWGVDTSTETDNGLTGDASSLPPYRALAYIMKT